MTRKQEGLAAQPHTGRSNQRLSRRAMLKRAAMLGLALPFASQLLAACGQDQSAQSAPAQSAAVATSAPAQSQGKPTTVRLTWGKGGLTLFAKTRGAFEQTLKGQGISVEWLGPFPNHAPTLQAVTGNTADFSFGGSSTPALASIINGSPLVFTSLILTEPRTTAILTLPNSGIASVKDLVGKKVAVNRSGLGEFLLVAALEKYSVPADQVERVYLNPPDAAPAFAENKVDAWAIWSGPREIAEVEYGAKPIFVDGEEIKKEEQIDVTSFLVREDYARDNAAVIRAVIDAYKAEATWSNENPKQVNELLAKESGWTPPVVAKIAAYNRQSTLIAPDDKASFDLQRAADWLADHKVLTEKLDVSKHIAKF